MSNPCSIGRCGGQINDVRKTRPATARNNRRPRVEDLNKIRTVIEDRAGRLHKLLAVVSETGANVVSIQHDRTNVDTNIGMSMLELTLETNDADHLSRVLSMMEENGYRIL